MTVTPTDDARTWIREGTGTVPRVGREARRALARNAARLRRGSVESAMAHAVAPYRRTPPAITEDPARGRGVPTHIVHASTYPVFPRSHGGAIRAHAMATALATDGFRSTIISLTHDPSQAGSRQLGDHLSELTFAIPATITDVEATLRLLSGPTALTDIVAGLCWPGMNEMVVELSRQLESAAAAVAVQPYLGRALDTLAPHVPLILDAHNDEYALKSQLLGGTPGGRWLLEQVRDLEATAAAKARMVVATTRSDLSALDRRYVVAAMSDVIPNGVDTAAIPWVTGVDRAERRRGLCTLLKLPDHQPIAIFIGSAHGPNVDAAQRIVELARNRPDVTFVLAGDHARLISRKVPPNVHLLGHVPEHELGLLMAGADLALNPIETGSGSNLKLLSYLASGLRVVATPTGVRGIDPERAGVVVREVPQLAAGIDEALAAVPEKLGEQGRRYVEQTADWTVVGEAFRNKVRLAVGR